MSPPCGPAWSLAAAAECPLVTLPRLEAMPVGPSSPGDASPEGLELAKSSCGSSSPRSAPAPWHAPIVGPHTRGPVRGVPRSTPGRRWLPAPEPSTQRKPSGINENQAKSTGTDRKW